MKRTIFSHLAVYKGGEWKEIPNIRLRAIQGQNKCGIQRLTLPLREKNHRKEFQGKECKLLLDALKAVTL